jgi:hypothetical protein
MGIFNPAACAQETKCQVEPSWDCCETESHRRGEEKGRDTNKAGWKILIMSQANTSLERRYDATASVLARALSARAPLVLMLSSLVT